MKATKTVQCGVVNSTRVKEELLTQEFENLQKFLHGHEDVELYSANKQQAKRYYDRIKDYKEYPISIRKDLIDVKKCKSDVCDYFVKIPVFGRYGGVNVPINTHTKIEDDCEICESKLWKEQDQFYLNITVEKEVKEDREYDGVLGIDLGLRNPVVGVGVTSVASPSQSEIMFRGEEIKRTQAKYFYLRRQSETGKGWHQREHNKVRDQLHKITTEIADYARENRLVVVVGDLGGIQKQDKGRKMNRKLHKFPHYSFREMLEYKCKERGIRYLEADEAYTSQICYKCGEKGHREKGLFVCSGSEMNADVNGANNIARRALGKPEIRSLLKERAVVAQPQTLSCEATSGASSKAISC